MRLEIQALDQTKANSISHERSDINSTIAEYREEYWEKHFEDCMTPMGTYECLVDMCTKVLGLIEYIKM